MFFFNIYKTIKNPAKAPRDPWDARTIEWMTDSPPKPHNFDHIPTVHTVDEFWHRKYAEDENHQMRRVATAEQVLAADPVDPSTIHMPSPSFLAAHRWVLRSSGYGLRHDFPGLAARDCRCT